jgi:hypothetical protein
MLPQGHTGEWHFCRGVWETEKQTFKSYADYGEHQFATHAIHSCVSGLRCRLLGCGCATRAIHSCGCEFVVRQSVNLLSGSQQNHVGSEG